MSLGETELATFSAVVDTLLPAVEGDGPAWATPGCALGLARRLPGVFSRLAHDQHRKDLRLFLRLLNSRFGGLVLYGRPKPFIALATQERAAAFRSMEDHRIGLIRGGAKALKTLVAMLWVTTEGPETRPGSWEAMGYPGPDGPPPQVAKPLPITAVATDTTMSGDVVVVGSGAGGGTAAGVLAAAGLDVIVLEAGEYRNEADFTHLEADAYRDLYLDGGLCATADGGMIVMSGATLGGGTVVNCTTSFATPNDIRAEWDAVGGFSEVFTGESYEDSVRAVQTRLSVNLDYCWPSPRAQLLEKGLQELSWHVDATPRNAVGCVEAACGYCTMGCRLGAKQSMLLTYLQDAVDSGARIVTGAYVERVLSDDFTATAVVARVHGATLTVKADAIVLCAGALQTPAILMRSGLGGRAAGDYLRLHPVTVVWARFSERVDPWTGILQARYSDEFANLDGSGYGFRLETAPVHPLFPAVFLGWEDGASFKRDVLQVGHLDVGGILVRDRGHGKVKLRRDGTPVWKYSISRYDQAHIREGVKRAAQLYAAAGAEELISSTVRPVRWRPGSGQSIEDYVARVDTIGYGSNRTNYFTFHQMGTARMGTDPATSVVGADNQVHDTARLFVMDGSCFPTASGVNPMLSIAAVAHRGAALLAERMA